jgi:uroporphyrinogen decarboxylase
VHIARYSRTKEKEIYQVILFKEINSKFMDSTPRERWHAILEGKTADRPPIDYWSTDEVTINLMKHFKVDTIRDFYTKLDIDVPIKIEPEYTGPPIPSNMDIFGCEYKDMNYGTGSYRECITNPLSEYKTVDEIERNYTWPNISDFDFSGLKEQADEWHDFPIEGGGSEPFLDYKNLRGQQQGYVDLFRYPEIVEYCLDQMFDFRYEYTKRIYREIPGKVTFSYVAEDFGSQNGLLMSPSVIKDIFLPRMKRMIDLAHRNGVYVFFHSDGAIREIIWDLIETGIDILNPIQWRCQGMDRVELKEEYGNHVIFHGAMDNQQTLPFGSVNDVRNEVQENIKILGEEGGYILAPCHNIQPITPTENILAMYDEAHKLYQ